MMQKMQKLNGRAEFVHEITEEGGDLHLSETFEELPPRTWRGWRLLYLRTLVHKGAQAKLAMGVT